MTVNDIFDITKHKLETEHIGFFDGFEKPLLLISTTYPGVWLEHVYDSVFYAMTDNSKLYLAENTIDLFIKNQTDDGQLPCYVLDKKKASGWRNTVGFSQIQECVSFAKLCLIVYKLNGDKQFLKICYNASAKWAYWLKKNRMTTKRNMVEMFVGYDTGHDNSGRLSGLSCVGNYSINGVEQNAAILPSADDVAPIIAVDMNCNYYATLKALSEMARELEYFDEANNWTAEAAELKRNLFKFCYNKDDCFFYDVDKYGNQRKFLSSTIFHLFLEDVLDKDEDAQLIGEIYRRHISNPEEFATSFPYPSMAINDPSCSNHKTNNCWGYYSQGLIALRTTLWMEKYGFKKEFENLCRKWVEAWTKHFDDVKMGQELDPITGIPTKTSEWYSSTMLFYLYAAKRIGTVADKKIKGF